MSQFTIPGSQNSSNIHHPIFRDEEIEMFFLIIQKVGLIARSILTYLGIYDSLREWVLQGSDHLEHFYDIKLTGYYSESAFLEAVLIENLGDEYDPHNRLLLREKIKNYQSAIARSIDRSFNGLEGTRNKELILRDWLGIYGVSEERKSEAICNRLQTLMSSPTQLNHLEMRVFSDLMKRPFYIFDRNSIRRIDKETGEMFPCYIFNEFFSTEPILLYTDEGTFSLLKRKHPLVWLELQNEITTLT